MEALEAAMKNRNLSLNFSSITSSHGHALSTISFTFNATSTSSSYE